MEVSRSKLCKGDVVFPCAGLIGKAAVINENEKYHINQNIAKITPNNTLSSQFLTYVLLSDITKHQILSFNASTSQPNVLVGNLRKFRIPVAPIEEQHEIASILSKVYRLIQKTDQIIEQTQKLKKGLMQRLLTKGIGHTIFTKTVIGEIPKNWSLVISHDLFSFVTSGSRGWASTIQMMEHI